MKNVIVAPMFMAFMSIMFSSQCYAEESRMNDKEHLYILWTNSDPITAEKYGFHVRSEWP